MSAVDLLKTERLIMVSQNLIPSMVDSVTAVPKNIWNALTQPDVPFFDHEFLQSLEQSGCFGEKSGWLPRYILLKNSQQELKAILPLFIKTHSYGEFIFDFVWAQAYHQHGFNYYPKLVAAFPFTPVTGKRLLFSADADEAEVSTVFREQIALLLNQIGGSSVHFLFCLEKEADVLTSHNFLKRHSYHFNWHNQNYKNFDDFLEKLKRKNRQQVLKERREIKEAGVTIEHITADQIKPAHADVFYKFYAHHHHERYGSPTYLTRDFFARVMELMSDRLLLVLAKKNGENIAGTFNFYKGRNLYGRYWGFTQEVKYLHFELCYYQLIEFAISRQLAFFDAGYQGEHKLKRGLLPVYAYSSHWLEHQGFQRGVAHYIQQEKHSVDEQMSQYGQHSPYKTE